MRTPGFIRDFICDIENVDSDIRRYVNKNGGFNEGDIYERLIHPIDTFAKLIEPPVGFEHLDYELLGHEAEQAGLNAIASGEVAIVLMASDLSFLKLPTFDVSLCAARVKQVLSYAKRTPIAIMSKNQIPRDVFELSPGIDICVLPHFVSYKLTPMSRLIFHVDDGKNCAEVVSCGSGDLLPSIIYNESSFLKNVKYLFVADVDNVGATINPLIIGHHILKESHVTCEVSNVLNSETLGSSRACYVQGHFQLVEDFMLPTPNIESHRFNVLGTNTMILSTNFITRQNIVSMFRTFHRIQKVSNKKVHVEHQRFLSSLTDASNKLRCEYVFVSRDRRYKRVSSEFDLIQAEHSFIDALSDV